jgi:uncharacterized protein (DUF4415 family)
MKNNAINNDFIMENGTLVHGSTDWNAFDALTEEEVTVAALADPDAQPASEEQLQRAKRVWDMPGNGLIEKLRALADENKQLLSVRYDPDVIAFFKAQGKGYQSLMNNVLRNYMKEQLEQNRA